MLGVLTFFQPALGLWAMTLLIAFWAILTGVVEVIVAIRLRAVIANEWFLALAGVLSVGLGVLLLTLPIQTLIALMWVVAGYALVFGVVLLVLAFRLRSWGGRGPTPGGL